MSNKLTLGALEKRALEAARRDYFRQAIDDMVVQEFRHYKRKNKERLHREVAELFEKEFKRQIPELVKAAVTRVRFFVDD
jgi:hypothetical protein